MENNNALMLNQNRELTPAIWGMLREIAPVMHVSRLFGVSSAEQATAIMLKGYELGMGVTSSFEFVQVIDGKPALSPRGALALIQSKGVLDAYKAEKIEKDGKFFGYSVYMKRGNTEHTATFTLEDAKRAQLTEGSPTSTGKRGYGNWEKYPENMCLWRAVGFAADFVCPDITGGLTTFLKMPEDFNVEISDTGDFVRPASNVIDVPKQLEQPTVPVITLNSLLAQYPAAEVMAANDGRVPGTDAEIQAVAEKLGAK